MGVESVKKTHRKKRRSKRTIAADVLVALTLSTLVVHYNSPTTRIQTRVGTASAAVGEVSDCQIETPQIRLESPPLVRNLRPEVLQQFPRDPFETDEEYTERMRTISAFLEADKVFTQNEIRDAAKTLERVRVEAGSVPLYKGRTVLMFTGSENIFSENTPQFESQRINDLIRAKGGQLETFSGRVETPVHCEWATQNSLQEAKENYLNAIAETAGPVNILLRLHGNQNGLTAGTFRENVESDSERVRITVEELAEAVFHRYQNLSPDQLGSIPDIITLDACASGAFAAALKKHFEENNMIVPHGLMIISATEDKEFTYGTYFIDKTLSLFNNSEVRIFYDGRPVGGDGTASQPTVRVFDRQTGRIIEIAESSVPAVIQSA